MAAIAFIAISAALGLAHAFRHHKSAYALMPKNLKRVTHAQNQSKNHSNDIGGVTLLKEEPLSVVPAALAAEAQGSHAQRRRTTQTSSAMDKQRQNITVKADVQEDSSGQNSTAASGLAQVQQSIQQGKQRTKAAPEVDTVVLGNFLGNVVNFEGMDDWIKKDDRCTKFEGMDALSETKVVKGYTFTRDGFRDYVKALKGNTTNETIIAKDNKRFTKTQQTNFLTVLSDLFDDAGYFQRVKKVLVERKPTGNWIPVTWAIEAASDKSDFDFAMDLGGGGFFNPVPITKEGSPEQREKRRVVMTMIDEATDHEGYYFQNCDFGQDKNGNWQEIPAKECRVKKTSEIIQLMVEKQLKVWVGCTGALDKRSDYAMKMRVWFARKFRQDSGQAGWEFDEVSHEQEAEWEIKAAATYFDMDPESSYVVMNMGSSTSQIGIVEVGSVVTIPISQGARSLSKGTGEFMTEFNLRTR